MSQDHMSRGSKVAALLPAITASAGKVRPAAISSEACPLCPLHITHHARARWSGRHWKR